VSPDTTALRRYATVAIIARLVQEFRIDQREDFYKVEAKFDAALTKRSYFKEGRRIEPIASPYPQNTMIWEAQFDSLADAESSFAQIESDPDHIQLLAEQLPYFVRRWTEFYMVVSPDGKS
jgi:hypothetical protein